MQQCHAFSAIISKGSSVIKLRRDAVAMQHQLVQPLAGKPDCPPSVAWPACRPAEDSAQSLAVDKAVARGLLDSALMALGSGGGAAPKGWDVEQGARTLAGPSADPLLALGRLPSISEGSASALTSQQCRLLPAQKADLSIAVDGPPLAHLALPSPVLRGPCLKHA